MFSESHCEDENNVDEDDKDDIAHPFLFLSPFFYLCLFSSSLVDGEGGELSPPVGAGIDSNSWHFRYGPGPGYGPPQVLRPGDIPPEAFIIPGSPAIISIRQGPGGEEDKSDFISFSKKEEAKKKKKKKKEKKDKKEKGKEDVDE